MKLNIILDIIPPLQTSTFKSTTNIAKYLASRLDILTTFMGLPVILIDITDGEIYLHTRIYSSVYT